MHERGARHLVDPARLVASAKRLYGEDFDRLWGEVVPIPERSLRVLRAASRSTAGTSRTRPATPRTTSATATRTRGWVFPGDTCGVRLPEGDLLLPRRRRRTSTSSCGSPSLDAIEAWEPATLAVTHFGDYRDVAAHLARLREALTTCGELARTTDRERYARRACWTTTRAALPERRRRVRAGDAPDHQWLGLDRYWQAARRGWPNRLSLRILHCR